MSGLIGVHELMWRNGSMEARGMIMHNGVYGSFGIDGDTEDSHTLCEGYIQGYVNGPAAYLSGGMVDYGQYVLDRTIVPRRALQNYNGSVYLIQGMQDWNVDLTCRSQSTSKSLMLALKSRRLQGNGLTIILTGLRDILHKE